MPILTLCNSKSLMFNVVATLVLCCTVLSEIWSTVTFIQFILWWAIIATVQDLGEDRESKDTVNTSVDILQSNGIEFADLEWFWNIPFSGVSGNWFASLSPIHLGYKTVECNYKLYAWDQVSSWLLTKPPPCAKSHGNVGGSGNILSPGWILELNKPIADGEWWHLSSYGLSSSPRPP